MRLRFILAEVFQGLRRNFSMTIAVILVTFISLTFVGSAALLQKQVSAMKDEWYDKVEVTIFLCPPNSNSSVCEAGVATDKQIAALKTQLDSSAMKPYVQNYYFQTPAEAYASYRERFPTGGLVDNIRPEDLPASFRVKLVNPEEYKVISDAFTGKPGVDEVKDQRAVLEPLFRLMNLASLASIGLAAIMMFASVLLINTTVRLSAIMRRRETEIMRLVGASNFVVQLPFMLETIVGALAGAGLAIGGLWLTVKYVIQDWLAGASAAVTFLDTSAVWSIAPWLVLIALTVGALSALIALRRYTKV